MGTQHPAMLGDHQKWLGRGKDAAFDLTTPPNWRAVLAKLEKTCKAKSNKSAKEEIQARNAEEQEGKRRLKDKIKFDNLKRDYIGEAPDQYLTKIEDFAASQETSSAIALMARTHALEYAEKNQIGDAEKYFRNVSCENTARSWRALTQ